MNCLSVMKKQAVNAVQRNNRRFMIGTQHTNALCEQNVEYFTVKRDGTRSKSTYWALQGYKHISPS